MFQSKKPKSSHGVHLTRKFRLCMDASCDMQSSHALNTQLPRIIAKRAIHHGVVMNGRRSFQFWSEPMKVLVDILNHAH